MFKPKGWTRLTLLSQFPMVPGPRNRGILRLCHKPVVPWTWGRHFFTRSASKRQNSSGHVAFAHSWHIPWRKQQWLSFLDNNEKGERRHKGSDAQTVHLWCSRTECDLTWHSGLHARLRAQTGMFSIHVTFLPSLTSIPKAKVCYNRKKLGVHSCSLSDWVCRHDEEPPDPSSLPHLLPPWLPQPCKGGTQAKRRGLQVAFQHTHREAAPHRPADKLAEAQMSFLQ